MMHVVTIIITNCYILELFLWPSVPWLEQDGTVLCDQIFVSWCLIKFWILLFVYYIAQSTKNLHVTLFDHCISKTARYSILSSLVKKSYLGDRLLNPEYQVIASRTFIYQQIQCAPSPLIFGSYGPFGTLLIPKKKITKTVLKLSIIL